MKTHPLVRTVRSRGTTPACLVRYPLLAGIPPVWLATAVAVTSEPRRTARAARSPWRSTRPLARTPRRQQ